VKNVVEALLHGMTGLLYADTHGRLVVDAILRRDRLGGRERVGNLALVQGPHVAVGVLQVGAIGRGAVRSNTGAPLIGAPRSDERSHACRPRAGPLGQ
jgi:hypothetical protein